jgi:very-short-patch-repair endonuclease
VPEETPVQRLARYVLRLKTYRDRLLQVDWRNRSIFLRRSEKKWNFDLGAILQNDPEKLDDVLRKAVNGAAPFCVIKDAQQGDPTDELRSNLTQLERTTRLIFDETGLKDTYLGFPFITGRLGEEGFIRAPLVLFPVGIEKVRGNNTPGWHLTFDAEGGAVVNRALGAALKREGVSLPPDLQDKIDDIIEAAPKEGLADYLTARLWGVLSEAGIALDAKVDSPLHPLVPYKKEEIAQLPRTPLRIEQLAIVGNFPQGSTAIFRDYETLIANAERGGGDQGVIDDLLEAPAKDEVAKLAGPIELDAIPDKEQNFALASDSSQEAVVAEAQRAECVVVRGPPGTGKSQVIVNLITNALAKEQRVLVVCQKRAALDVVYQRLGRASLDGAATLLHDARADRNDVYARLSRRMEGDTVPVDERAERELAETSAQIDQVIADLNGIVKPLWQEYYGGARLQELYAAARSGYAPHMNLGSLPGKLTRASLSEILLELPSLQTGFVKFDTPSSPVHARRSFAGLEASAKFGVENALTKAEGASTQEGLCLSTVEEQRRMLALLDDYVRYRNRTFKFLSGRWRRAKKGVASLQASHPNDPRTASLEALQRTLTAGLDLHLGLADLQTYWQPTGLSELLMLAGRPDDLRARLAAARAALAEFDAIQEHDKMLASLDSVGTESFQLLSSTLLHGTQSWAWTFEQEVMSRWIGEIETQNRQLSGDPFGRYLELCGRLQKLTDKRRALFQKRLASRLLHQAHLPQLPPGDHHPNKRPETDWNRMLNEFRKKRRIRSVRQLMDEFSFQLLTVAPCWLVSPEAASEVFPLDRGMFDLVIFDESSQLAVERALPSLYRGKRVIVAGDEKQLRPFDLFRARDEEDEQEADEVTEAESLLMLSMRVFTPRYLSWHYRSKYQELIDFSNHAFYDGNLQIAANVLRAFQAPPLEFVRVEGRWEDRTNYAEAEKVVDLMASVLREGEKAGKPKSVGVITFNDPQRELVEDTIDARRTRDPAFDALFKSAEGRELLDDRPFVKNIENVQGDERDVIIFTVAYAPDSSGKLRVMFGSLNQEGGENRLNVAVTRARERITVVASFAPADLPVEDTKNLGPKRLKEYLLYAEAVSEARRDAVSALLNSLGGGAAQYAAPSGIAIFDSPLEAQLKDALTALGYAVDTNVGFSGYRVDLAVVDPGEPSRYCLGIECDGAMFQSAKSARERDVTRKQFMTDRGWTIDRVWSRNWWRNRPAEVERIKTRIDALSTVPKMTMPKPLPPAPEPAPAQVAFFRQLETKGGSGSAEVAQELIDWADEYGMKLWWRMSADLPMVTPCVERNNVAHFLFSILADGNIAVHLGELKPPMNDPERKRRIVQQLNLIKGVAIKPEAIRGTVSIPLAVLRTEFGMEAFTSIASAFAKDLMAS